MAGKKGMMVYNRYRLGPLRSALLLFHPSSPTMLPHGAATLSPPLTVFCTQPVRCEELQAEFKQLSHDTTQSIQALEAQLTAARTEAQSAKRELDVERSRSKMANAEMRTACAELMSLKDVVNSLRNERNAFEREIENLRAKLTIAHRDEAKQWEATVSELRTLLRETEVSGHVISPSQWRPLVTLTVSIA